MVGVGAVGPGRKAGRYERRSQHGGGDDPGPDHAAGHPPRLVGEDDLLDVGHDERDQNRGEGTGRPVEQDPSQRGGLESCDCGCQNC